MVRSVLRQRVLRAASPAEPLGGLVVTGRAIERETAQVAGVAVHLAARLGIGLEVFEGLVVVLQPEPRFGRHALEFGAALGNGFPGQFRPLLHDIAVVALAEFDLHQIERNDVPVGVATRELREALLRPAGPSFGIVDIGFVVERVVGVLAAAADPVEMPVGRLVIAGGELHIPHPDVVLFAARRAQGPVLGPFERLPGLAHVTRGAVERPQRETHVVGVNGAGITLLEVPERPFGIGAAQLHGAGGQVKVDLLDRRAVRRVRCRPGTQEFVPGIAPASEIEQVAAAFEGRRRILLRGLRRQRTRREEREQDIPKFSHTFHN